MWPGYVTLWRQPVPVCRGIQPIVDEYFSSLGPSVTETVCSPGMTEIFDSGCHITSTIIQSSCSDKPWQTLSWSGGRRRTRQKPKSDVAEPRTRQAFWLWYPNPAQARLRAEALSLCYQLRNVVTWVTSCVCPGTEQTDTPCTLRLLLFSYMNTITATFMEQQNRTWEDISSTTTAGHHERPNGYTIQSLVKL